MDDLDSVTEKVPILNKWHSPATILTWDQP